ncbi:glycosyltransferase family 4 protein [Patescibacteria group bacterium]|nr:glycosyltransferase family 4 protein [Patescibacteria group bacterium]
MSLKKKKIIYLVTKGNWGGAQKYVFDLASEMAERDNYEVVVAYGEPYGELGEKLKTAGIRTIEINGLGRDINLLGELGVARSLWKIFRGEKPDVIHLNSPKIGGLGALIGRLCGVNKIIYTAHGWTFNEKRPMWQIILIKYFSWVTILLSHKTIVIAKKEYRQVIDWPFVTTKKLVRIYNGIKPIYFLNREQAQEIFAACLPKRQDKVSNDDLVIGTIAELHKNKGLKYLIKAFRRLVREFENQPNQKGDLKLIIIGEGEERAYLENKLNKYGLNNNVFLVGAIDEASRYLKAYDIFVLPSIKEGFPYVLLEAGLAKLPVVASDVGGISELIRDGENGILVEAKDDDEIEEALGVLINDEGLREGYGRTLYDEVKSEFSFEAMVEEVEGLY